MDKSLLNGLSVTTPVLLDGYTETNDFDGWDTFSGEFIFSSTNASECRARLAPGQTVPGYTDCYIRQNSFQPEGLVTRAKISGMGFIHTTTTRVKYTGDSAGSLVAHKQEVVETGRILSWIERGTEMSCVEYRIVTTTIPFVTIQTRQNPPEIPNMPELPGFAPTGHTTWYIDSIRPTMCGKTVSLLEVAYQWKTLTSDVS